VRGGTVDQRDGSAHSAGSSPRPAMGRPGHVGGRAVRIAVTGAAGFIGRALTAHLAASGHRAVPFDLPRHDVRRPLSLAGADHATRLAGVLGTSELFGRVNEALEVNVLGTANVLAAAAAVGAGYTGITMPAVFPSVYTASKIAGRELERAFHHAG